MISIFFITVLHATDKFPTALDSFFYGFFRLPTEKLFREIHSGIYFCKVSRTSPDLLERYLFSRRLLGHPDHLQNACPSSCPDIHRRKRTIRIPGYLFQFSVCGDMGIHEIVYIDIVTDSCAIDSRIVISEYPDFFPFSEGNIEDIRKKVIRNPVRLLADVSGRMSADRIEVSERKRLKRSMKRKILKDILYHELARTIGIGCPELAGLCQWKRVIGRIYGCRARKDDPPHFVSDHGLEKVDASENIVPIIQKRLFTALSYGFQSREMDHPIETMFRKNFIKRLRIADISLMEIRNISEYLSDLREHLFGGIGQIIDDNRCISRLLECNDRMGSDISGSSGYEYGFFHSNF